MSAPTPPERSEPHETRAFAAPVPPAAEPVPVAPRPVRTRRSSLLMGAAAAGLLAVGVVVGVVVGQATAGSAAADTGSTTQQVGPGQYGTPPDGAFPGGQGRPGGHGLDAAPDGTTPNGTTPDGTTGNSTT